MSKASYLSLLRVVALATSATLWVLSINFSVDGFNIQVRDLTWAGVALGLAVTVLQLIWNKPGMRNDLTILVAGLCAYAYGIWTNVVGVMGQERWENLTENPLSIIFPLILGFLLEVTPERLLVWGITGSSEDGDDLLSTLVNRKVNLPNIPKVNFRPAPPPVAPHPQVHKPNQQHPRVIDGERRGGNSNRVK